MFKSKKRAITIPQSEHARLAGYLAQYWGNSDVQEPTVDRISFVSGVTHHDRGYGHLDTMAIGEVDETIWIATQQRGIRMQVSDPIADSVALMHIRRLLSHAEGEHARTSAALAEAHIKRNIGQTSYTRQEFERADAITALCDDIAFKFCFEQPAQFTQSVWSQGGMLPIHVQLGDGGRVQLDPWPLAAPELRGFIIGYELSGYPDHLEPVLVEFEYAPQH
jgi:hypothetical protein